MPRTYSGGEGIPPEPVLRQLRVPMIRRATLTTRGREETLMTIDVGLRGLFVERDQPLPVNESVAVRFTLPDNVNPLAARCRVAWWHPPDRPLVNKTLPAGLGLEFLEISEPDTRRLRAHVEEYCRQQPKMRQFHPMWPEGA
jgi:Tfp pilus assembly protein PilZ